MTYPGLIWWRTCFQKETLATLRPALILLSLRACQSLFCDVSRRVSLHGAKQLLYPSDLVQKIKSAFCVRGDEVCLIGAFESSVGNTAEKQHSCEKPFQTKRNKNPGEIREGMFAKSGKASCRGTETKYENALYL